MDTASGKQIFTKNYEISEDMGERLLSRGSYLRLFRQAKNLEEAQKAMNHTMKAEVVYNGVDTFMMRRLTFLYLMEGYAEIKGEDRPLCTAVYRVNKTLPLKTVRPTISGGQARNLFWEECLKNEYTKEEAEAALKAHEADYDRAKRQVHLLPTSLPFIRPNVVYKVDNCVSYDINGAHTYALLEIFPKAEEEIRDLYERRHSSEVCKNIANYYVGMLTRRNHRRTYNWIVQLVTGMIIGKLQEEEKAGGFPLYVNTDGAICAYPDKVKRYSESILGGFKIEYEGPAYFYLRNKPGESSYYALQLGEEIKGTVALSARQGMDLRRGLVTSYLREHRIVNEVEFYEIGKKRIERAKIEEINNIWTKL